MASASPVANCIAGKPRVFTGEAFTFFGFGGTTKAATPAPGSRNGRPDRGGHHPTASGDGRPT